MNFEKQIKAWLETGLINQEQASKMLVDVTQKNKEEKSNKFIVAISTIGALLLGIGAILLVASNWKGTPNIVKVLILMVSTFGTYYLGFLFKYEKKNLPKVGASLFFLGALLFGVSIFLIAQIYHVNANAHFLMIIWLIGILPLIYAFKSQSIAALSAVVYFVWIGLFVFRGLRFIDDSLFTYPVIYLAAGTLLFGIGGLHYIKPDLHKIARIFRIAGIKISLLSLFLLTFNFFSGETSKWFDNSSRFDDISGQLITGVVLFSILSMLNLFANLFFNPSKSKNNKFESILPLVLLGLTLILFMFPVESNIYTVLYNIIFAVLTISLIYIGYQKSDIKIVNIGTFWLSIFLFAKYFDFFWDLMDRSIFFLVGGIILIMGSIALEKKRRKLKQEFLKSN